MQIAKDCIILCCVVRIRGWPALQYNTLQYLSEIITSYLDRLLVAQFRLLKQHKI